MSYSVGATAASDNDAAMSTASGASASWSTQLSKRVKIGLAANTVFTAMYKSPATSAAHFANRSLYVTPIRVQ